MRFFYILSVFFHILSAAVWIGGMAFFAFVVVPLIRNPEYRSSAPALVEWLGRRFRYVGWICLSLLTITGYINLSFRGFGLSDFFSSGMWTGFFGEILFVKLHFAALIFLASGIHDFYIGPRATLIWKKDPDSPQAMKWRKTASWFGRLNFVMSLAALLCGIMLIRGWAW